MGRRSVAGGRKKVGGAGVKRVVGENKVMHVYIRGGPQSFHLGDGINGAQHIISVHSCMIGPVRLRRGSFTGQSALLSYA